MGRIYFSPSMNAFYPLSMKGDYEASLLGWPKDAFEIGQGIYQVYALSSPPEGKSRGVDSEGFPVWVDTPPLVGDDLTLANQLQHTALMDAASKRIAALVEAQDDGDITAEELNELTALRSYRVSLRRLELVAGEQVEWPEKP